MFNTLNWTLSTEHWILWLETEHEMQQTLNTHMFHCYTEHRTLKT